MDSKLINDFDCVVDIRLDNRYICAMKIFPESTAFTHSTIESVFQFFTHKWFHFGGEIISENGSMDCRFNESVLLVPL